MRKLSIFAAAGLVLLAGCARKAVEVVAAPPVVAPVPVPPARQPLPPAGAAANLRIPASLPDGSYATPNRGIGVPAQLWHVRSALNVAALSCAPQVTEQYNAAIRTHAAELRGAHRALEAEYRAGGADWQDRFDDAMTRVYNYWSQPPVHGEFCAVAEALAREVAAVPAGGLGAFAQGALPRLEAPFLAFYRAYDGYRVELAAWNAKRAPVAAPAPRLGVDMAVLVAGQGVTGGGARFAAR